MSIRAVILAVVLAVLGLGRVGAATTAPVAVSMFSTGNDVYRVTITWPDVPDKAFARQAAADLAQRAQWAGGNITWQTTSADKRIPPQTSVSFTVVAPFAQGQIPIEAFAVAFRQWKTVNLVVAHGGALAYSGKPLYEDKDVAISTQFTEGTLSMSIKVKNPKLERITFQDETVAQAPKSGTRPRPVKRSVPLWMWVTLAAAGGLMAWLVVYAWLLPGKPRNRAR